VFFYVLYVLYVLFLVVSFAFFALFASGLTSGFFFSIFSVTVNSSLRDTSYNPTTPFLFNLTLTLTPNISSFGLHGGISKFASYYGNPGTGGS
jgi:hypothetical protein